MTQYINTLAFEIDSPERYDLAVALCPSLSEIPFEAVHGHFYGMTGELRDATIPPGALKDNDITIVSGEFKPLKILQFIRE